MSELMYPYPVYPMIVCKTCGTTDSFNPDCTECEKTKLDLECDKFYEMWLDAENEREEMNYADDLNPEDY